MSLDCLSCNLLDYVPLGIFLIDDEYKIVFWNQWLREKTAITAKQARGKRLGELVPDHENPRYDWAVEQAITRKSPQVLSQALNRYLIPIKNPPTGRHGIAYMQQHVMITPVTADDGRIHALVSIMDVTENVMRSSALTEMAQKLEQDSNHDQLTGIHNRRFMWEWLLTQIKQSVRYEYPIACLLFDIDRFKELNDTYGHERGDKVLREFAALICKTLRDSDIVVRYGGEEFVAMLPHCDMQGGIATAHRILKLIRDSSIAELDTGFLTCSIGVSVYHPDDPCSGAELLKTADKCLYEAKNNGRNQVFPAK